MDAAQVNLSEIVDSFGQITSSRGFEEWGPDAQALDT
jgi:hypothetical protein